MMGGSQPGDADPYQAQRHAQGGQTPRARKASTSASCSRSPRSARTWAVPRRCTSSRLIASCARATSRSSTHCISQSRFSARRRARWRNCRLRLTRTGTWSLTVTSSSPSGRHFGSEDNMSPKLSPPNTGRRHGRTGRGHRLSVTTSSAAMRRQTQQGLPDALVVLARRDRAVYLHRAAAHRRVPDAVLRPLHERRHLQRCVSAAARRGDVEGVRVSARTSASRCAAGCSSARSTTGRR